MRFLRFARLLPCSLFISLSFAADAVWLEDALPSGATVEAAGGDAWSWVSAAPSPFSGQLSHQSNVAKNRIHEHGFTNVTNGFTVAAGDVLFAYVYLDPANAPTEVMLSWNDGSSWEHRAYWGANRIAAGVNKTASRYAMGALPVTGQWVRLEVPANLVALEGRTVTGMRFSLYSGRATWDRAGVASVATQTSVNTTVAAPVFSPAGGTFNAAQSVTISSSTSGATIRYTVDGTIPTATTGTVYSGPVTIGAGATTLNAIAYASGATNSTVTAAVYQITTSTAPTTATPSVAENSALALPRVGDNALTVLTPTVLELRRITTKQPDPATVTEWNFFSTNGTYKAPATTEFVATANGQTLPVKAVGFRRRAAYAPLNQRDLRIDNYLFLELGANVPEGAVVEVKNPSGALWPATMVFKSTAAPLRHNPAIHVNQEGYVPSLPKKAMIGYYLGTTGELDVTGMSTFQLVAAATGATVYQGSLTVRRETGFVYSPLPYQKVLQADFTNFTTPGEYQLVVPGMGASLPFVVDDGVAMAFARTYATGIYHQRCGAECAMPYSRFTHAACHMAAAEVPSPQSSFGFTWTTIASKNSDAKDNPRHTAPQLKDEVSQLYPFVNKGTIDVSGGHHDAGDYSKYTINVAHLVHLLGFAAESIGGAGALDNLGLPESGDGVGDILQEAKREADYLAKLQDGDGGFYFIVYPKQREYESDVAPDKGDPQVVWPKNTAATAASVAALAQMASSPKFKAAYPTVAANYLSKAKLGWQFLINAINKFGKDGSYQKVTFYGDNYMHDDELAWAAAELFAATGEAQYHQKLLEWFPDPADPNTFRYGWWRMNEAYGNAIRAYAFAARSGRLAGAALNATYLAKCEEQVRLAGDDALNWSNQSAYGSSFPEASKHYLGAGWYFSLDQASDIAVAYQLNPKSEYIDALLANLNYEAGTNPVDVTFVSGLGLKRQRELVHQWANTDHRKMPMPGIPVGNITANFSYLSNYGASGNELTKLSYPTDDTATPGTMYPFYDRWTDTWNVTAEFITLNQARSLVSSATLASLTAAKSVAWKPAGAVKIVTPSSTVPLGEPVTLTLDAGTLNLAGARILWEARDQEPDFGSTYTVTPKSNGDQWVEVEITWADGRRLFGVSSFKADSPVVTWVDDAMPAGAGALGNEAWNWVSTSPAPAAGTRAHQSTLASGLHEHAFDWATSPLIVNAGDKLFVHVYLDPANIPSEIMLSWNDGTWEHRAYWGANLIGYGTNGTASRYYVGAMPAAGQWVRLELPASAVALEGRSVKGMSFSCYGGRATWDAAGKSAPLQ